MLSKDEIEKAKEVLNKLKDYKVLSSSNFQKLLTEEEKDAIETLSQYIDQLEQENNRQNKMIDLMATSINGYDSQLDICQYSNKEEVKQYYKEYLEQYFEKKVEEK